MDRTIDVVRAINNLYNLKNNKDQKAWVMNNVTVASVTTSQTYVVELEDGVESGVIQITTDAAYDGTTGTLALYGSADGVNYGIVYQDDNTTPMSFTPAAGANSLSWLIKRTMYGWYRILYTKGDGTVGVIIARFIGKK